MEVKCLINVKRPPPLAPPPRAGDAVVKERRRGQGVRLRRSAAAGRGLIYYSIVNIFVEELFVQLVFRYLVNEYVAVDLQNKIAAAVEKP